jgi:hypothetical protein
MSAGLCWLLGPTVLTRATERRRVWSIHDIGHPYPESDQWRINDPTIGSASRAN